MIYTIYILENTKAKICVSKTTTDLEDIKNMIVKTYKQKGFIVNVDIEE